jgi:hypothetical protein
VMRTPRHQTPQIQTQIRLKVHKYKSRCNTDLRSREEGGRRLIMLPDMQRNTNTVNNGTMYRFCSCVYNYNTELSRRDGAGQGSVLRPPQHRKHLE